MSINLGPRNIVWRPRQISNDFALKNDLLFVLVQPGEFRSGGKDPVAGIENSLVIWKSIERPLLVAQRPVTSDLYHLFRMEMGSRFDPMIEIWSGIQWEKGGTFTQHNNPPSQRSVIGVSYNDCLDFLAWLNKIVRADLRLPTESEYEYAARAGCTCEDTCIMSMECKARNLTRTDKESPRNSQHQVREYPINKWGIQAMNGHIWQWCGDWFEKNEQDGYSSDKCTHKSVPEHVIWRSKVHFNGRVIRGGSFNYTHQYAACFHRHFSYETDRNCNLGFRLVAPFESSRWEPYNKC